MAELHDLVAAYALNALDDEDRVEFEVHLSTCEKCIDELTEMASATSELAGAVAASPPDRMKAAVLEAIATTPQVASEPEIASAPLPIAPRMRFRRWVVALGAAALIVIAVVVSGIFDNGIGLNDVTAAPDSAAVLLAGEIGSARFVYSDSLDTGFFIATVLPAVGEQETYQLWLIDDTGPAPAGTFRPEDDGSVEFRVERSIAPGQTLGMTIEPAGGSPAPTGEVLLAEVLG